ncbi:MAG: LPS export ABC transporter permease LptG [Deltaproteobacteria bacterium]|nr:LPS export ABC transporter permease LptG [Deltaproteobacteria bacterium]
MNILTRYILREFTKMFIIALLAFLMIYVVVDFFERIDNFVEAGAGSRYMLLYIFFKLPLILEQMLPVAVLLATLVALGLLARSNEIVAMKASGISPLRLTTPLLICGLVISVLSLMNSELVVPYTNRRVNSIWRNHVEKESPEFSHKYEALWYRGKDIIYNIRSFDDVSNTLFGVVVNQFDPDFRVKQRIHARRAIWENGHWLFLDGTIKQRQRDGGYTVSTFSEKVFPLSETPDDFKKGGNPSDEMSFTELRRYAQKVENEGYSARSYWVDMHIKLAFPCISFIMILIGASLALWKEKGRGVAAGIGIGFVIIALYLVTLELTRTLGYSGILPPIIAAWASNILFAMVGAYLLLCAHR